MRHRPAGLALCLLAFPAGAWAEGWVGASAGGGFDSNLNLGVAGAPAAEAGFGDALLRAGVAAGLGEHTDLAVEATWDSVRYPAYRDLALDRPGAGLALALDATPWLRLRLSGDAGVRLAADTARDGWDGTAQLALLLRLHRLLAARASAGLHHREARDAAYAGDGLRGLAGVELELGARAWLGVSWRIESGDTTVSTTVATYEGRGGAGRGPGRTTTSFGSVLVAQRVRAEVHSIGGSLHAELGAGLSLELDLRQAWVRGEGLTGEALTGSLRLGWRWRTSRARRVRASGGRRPPAPAPTPRRRRCARPRG